MVLLLGVGAPVVPRSPGPGPADVCLTSQLQYGYRKQEEADELQAHALAPSVGRRCGVVAFVPPLCDVCRQHNHTIIV